MDNLETIKMLQIAIGNLLQLSIGNRGDREGNPYCQPEVKQALQALHCSHSGVHAVKFTAYCDSSDRYK